MKIDSIDISRALIRAKAVRKVYVNLADEGFEEGTCSRLSQSMYGTRGAAQNRGMEYIQSMKSIGSSTGTASPCDFVSPNNELRCKVHGDDFTMLGWQNQIDCSHRGRTGPSINDPKEMSWGPDWKLSNGNNS